MSGQNILWAVALPARCAESLHHAARQASNGARDAAAWAETGWGGGSYLYLPPAHLKTMPKHPEDAASVLEAKLKSLL